MCSVRVVVFVGGVLGWGCVACGVCVCMYFCLLRLRRGRRETLRRGRTCLCCVLGVLVLCFSLVFYWVFLFYLSVYNCLCFLLFCISLCFACVVFSFFFIEFDGEHLDLRSSPSRRTSDISVTDTSGILCFLFLPPVGVHP